MRAAVLRRIPRADELPLEIAEVAEPRPAPGQVAIRVEACGVCRTDLHIVEGEVRARLPIVPGHQAAGRVVDVGEGVESPAAGQLVGVGWLASTCGVCAYCLAGRENLCASATFTGRDVDGGFADTMVADARFVFPLPASMSAVEAAPLLCAGIIGYRSLRLSEVRPGGRLGLFGFGASAHLAIQVALHWGCEVYAFTREEHHRQLALDLGARWAGEATDDPGVPLDAAVLFAPAGELVPAILRRLDRGATLAINAIHMTDVPPLAYDDLYWERTVRSVANYTRQDAREFLDLAAEIPVRAGIERFSPDGVNDALARIKRGEVHGAAVIEMT
ncbi:MAG: zinc-binding alcohol dehydrogenase family protein [Dehalococcoidia bacterium]|nr:MAG: zinc-binding alcohol dehydrogenase family protein [Dehalococcoidia bacterium]